MLGQEHSLATLQQALALSTADQTEVLLLAQDSGLTRFANNAIHQNVAETNAELRVRTVLGKRVGVASTHDVSSGGIARVVETAREITRFQAENGDFKSLPPPEPIATVAAYFECTAQWGPEGRARWAAAVCRLAAEAGLSAAGAFQTGRYEVAVANSLGVSAYYASALAELNATVMSESSSGYAEFVSMDANSVDAEALGREAIERALRGRQPADLAPGEYPVVLESYAVGDMLDNLAYLGFSALALQEGRSFMRLGERIMGGNISIWDDALDRTGVPMPFDYEGVPKRHLDIIEDGMAQGVAYDSYTAGRDGKQSTGHALPAPNSWGPYPMNQFLEPGEATREQMIASVDRGLLVTRFWYTRPVEPLRAVITGMTRDGTFLIERGEVTRPVKNLRFTESYLDAMSRVEMLSRATRLGYNGYAATRVPAIKVSSFRFTGVTEH
ncbi:MAG: TldD/PmbA family protein [Bacteroidetes bacterium]|nr:TldD/PmbA family protein [Bacteroidota bacterium]MCL5026493.1 TldD/PmbA family protein [Chloroflexota bacterium]